MPRNLIVNALGCAVTLDLSARSEADAAAVSSAWSGAIATDGDPLPATHLTVQVPASTPLPEALSKLSQDVTLAALNARRNELWMLHAAGVSDEEGRVIVLVGPSGQGKTTASRNLAAHFGYVSDETVAIAPNGAVIPYRKPLSVIETQGEVKVQRSPGELDLVPLPAKPLTVAAVVLLNRQSEDGPATPRVEPCDLGDAIPDLVAQTSYLGDHPAPLRLISAIAAATGGVHLVTYREASTLPEALAPLFRTPRPVEIPDPLHEPRTHAGGEGIYRGAFIDAIELANPDRIVLLQPEPDGGSTFRLIAGIAPALWRAAEGATVEELVVATIATYGQPDGVNATQAVTAALEELRSHAILTTEPTWRVREDVAYAGSESRYVALSRRPPEPVTHRA